MMYVFKTAAKVGNIKQCTSLYYMWSVGDQPMVNQRCTCLINKNIYISNTDVIINKNVYSVVK